MHVAKCTAHRPQPDEIQNIPSVPESSLPPQSITISPQYFLGFHHHKAVSPCFELHIHGIVLW